MKSRILSFILSLIAWLILTWSVDWQHLLIGLLASIFVSWAVGDLFTENPWKLKDPKRYLWAVYYIIILIWEMIKANLDVAYRVVHPGIPIKPGIVKVRTKLKSDAALTYLANSITLTPGTFTIDIDKENGFLYIHWINVVSEDIDKATEVIVQKFERILEKIFE
ncbi:MAG: cation:proton antiporter [Elusimicrobia bacterium CG_4_10_14_0_8_um_filter_37_32]|nr:MAG: cation:proton antiporter [Elusimicrobia bacterium CG02_land_8_20_14_3_00_37_13]PIZ13390.1 MAG: cation:proton antiporter [Elusimicrobia bacterium CG_4_10_14_0_8_um_filter_37_32]